MKAILLNYAISCVEVVTLPIDMNDFASAVTERIENYLHELGYSLEEIAYMVVDGDCPVYQDSDKPTFFI